MHLVKYISHTSWRIGDMQGIHIKCGVYKYSSDKIISPSELRVFWRDAANFSELQKIHLHLENLCQLSRKIPRNLINTVTMRKKLAVARRHYRLIISPKFKNRTFARKLECKFTQGAIYGSYRECSID